MASDALDRLSIDEDLNPFDLGKIEGERIDDGIDGHHLRRTSSRMLFGECRVKINLSQPLLIYLER